MLLVAEDLCKTFDREGSRFSVLDGVSLSVGRGQTLALTGEAGSGKSTLLHLLGALDHPDSGRITLDGAEISNLDDNRRAAIRRNKIGLIFQQFNLIPSLDVADNLGFQARLAGRFDPAWASQLITRLGLDDCARQFPENLSGGQQQRVAIGRALAARPAVILADEPTGNLDEETSNRVMDLMLELVAETDAAFLMVTHSTRMAARLDQRLHLSAGQLA